MSSQLKMLVISDWLQTAAAALKEVGITSAQLDAEIILAHTLRKPRTFLHAHPSDPIDQRNREIADARLQLRLDRTPVAYIIGHKEFYGRQFKVTPTTLIPRPESETILTLLRKYHPIITGSKLIDVGTGSGCLGITAKLEFPKLEVTLIDISRHALHIAEFNATHHKADIASLQSNLLEHYPFTADIILANLPYVDTSWERSPETAYEPALALFAPDSGLHLIKRLLIQTGEKLSPGGLIFIEADTRQHAAIIANASRLHLNHLETEDLILVFQKPS